MSVEVDNAKAERDQYWMGLEPDKNLVERADLAERRVTQAIEIIKKLVDNYDLVKIVQSLKDIK